MQHDDNSVLSAFLVDDEVHARESLQLLLQRGGHAVEVLAEARDLASAREQLDALQAKGRCAGPVFSGHRIERRIGIRPVAPFARGQRRGFCHGLQRVCPQGASRESAGLFAQAR